MSAPEQIDYDYSEFGKDETIKKVIEELINKDHLKNRLMGKHFFMPSPDALKKVIKLLRFVFFPEYFMDNDRLQLNSHFSIGSEIEQVYTILQTQLSRGLSYSCQYRHPSNTCMHEASQIINRFIRMLPHIKELLISDVEAGFEGDPAAKSYGEVISSYPSVRALINYRVAHELYLLKVPMIPRIITELAHFETGIDIHPGADIGRSFFMDHGTGIVIGETAIIGNDVRLYQGVTLGARSFSRNRDGSLVKGRARHPIIGNSVIIYSGTTILGRIKIGNKVIIGGNLWVTEDVPEGSKLIQNRPKEGLFFNGEGI